MSFKLENFRLKVGMPIKGMKGKHEIMGYVLESTKKPGKPAIFSRYGFVGVWVETEDGYKTVINNIEAIE